MLVEIVREAKGQSKEVRNGIAHGDMDRRDLAQENEQQTPGGSAVWISKL
jgi:hypothetical protein